MCDIVIYVLLNNLVVDLHIYCNFNVMMNINILKYLQ